MCYKIKTLPDKDMLINAGSSTVTNVPLLGRRGMWTGRLCVACGGTKGIRGISVSSSQSFYEPNTALKKLNLKNKCYFKMEEGQWGSTEHHICFCY